MRHDRLFETCLDAAAAAWMAGSAAFALALLAETLGGLPGLPISLGGSIVAALVTFRFLQQIEPVAAPLPPFDLVPLVATDPEPAAKDEGELLLTSNMALPMPELLVTRAQMILPAPTQDELLLDDVLVQPRPESRVVQLFDPSRIPTAGELKARIDRHLRSEPGSAAESQPDASQALFDALAELRRSLG